MEEGFDNNLLRQAAAQRSRALIEDGVRLTKADQPREANRAFDSAEKLDPACVALIRNIAPAIIWRSAAPRRRSRAAFD